MNILIIYHQKYEALVLDRIYRGFKNLNCNVDIIKEYENISDKSYNITFIDPSLDFNPIKKIKSDVLMFFDCEDDPDHFNPNIAYYELKDKIVAYAKITWKNDNKRGDNIPNIGIPLPFVSILKQVANFDASICNSNEFVPFFIGSGTFIPRYQLIQDGIYFRDEIRNIQSIGQEENHLIYNQRINWLLMLQHSKIPYVGGITFYGDKNTNTSLIWQQEKFGSGVKYLRTDRIFFNNHIEKCFDCKIGLSPSGHGRICYRLLDYMATGSIIFTTDLQGSHIFPMPKYYITVYDNENIADVLLTYQKQYKELWKISQENKKLISITNEEIIKLFKDQYK